MNQPGIQEMSDQNEQEGDLQKEQEAGKLQETSDQMGQMEGLQTQQEVGKECEGVTVQPTEVHQQEHANGLLNDTNNEAKVIVYKTF